MKKIVKDYILLFVLSFMYILLHKGIKISAVEDLIITLGIAGLFTLLSEIIRQVNEQNLKLKTGLSAKQVEKVRKIRLVIRDSVLTYLLCYGYMTAYLGGSGLSLVEVIPFLIAALAPTVVVSAISKEMRIPSKKIVERDIELELRGIA